MAVSVGKAGQLRKTVAHGNLYGRLTLFADVPKFGLLSMGRNGSFVQRGILRRTEKSVSICPESFAFCTVSMV